MKKPLLLTVAASLLAVVQPLDAGAGQKPKKPQVTEPTYEQVLAACKKQYGNGGPMRPFKKNGKWWCQYRI